MSKQRRPPLPTGPRPSSRNFSVTDTLQLEDAIQLHEGPKLLVEWSSPWQEFVTSIRPAFARSGPRLAGEAPNGIFPYWGMLASLLLEALFLFVIMVLPRQIAHLRPYAPPRLQPDEVLYYSGDELPRTEDLGGAEAGATGRAGGREAHHRTQTIHVARGSSLAPKIVDAPDLKLPSSIGAVANLLALKSNPGPPPAEGLHSSLIAPSLPANVIAPAPVGVTRDVARDQSRGGLTLDSVVAPAPGILSGKSRTAPARSSRAQCPIRTHPRCAVSGPEHHRPGSQCFAGTHTGRTFLKLQRDWPGIHARLPRPGAFHSGAQRQRDSARSRGREPRSLAFARANEQRRGRASASFLARARDFPQFETQSARALRHRTAAFRRFRARSAPARKRQRWRLLASRSSSATNSSGQWIVREQHDRQTFRYTGRRAASALDRRIDRRFDRRFRFRHGSGSLSLGKSSWCVPRRIEHHPSASIGHRLRYESWLLNWSRKFRRLGQWHAARRHCCSASTLHRLGQKRLRARRSRRCRLSSRSSQGRRGKQRQFWNSDLVAARLTGRNARQWRQRLARDVPHRRRRAGPRRLRRRLGHRPRRQCRQRNDRRRLRRWQAWNRTRG